MSLSMSLLDSSHTKLALGAGAALLAGYAAYRSLPNGRKLNLKQRKQNDGLFKYISDSSLRPNPVLDRLQTHTREHVSRAAMLGAAEELQFLANLLRSTGARRAIDVGVYTGSSSLAIAQVLPEDGKVLACDVSEEYTSVGKQFWQEAGVQHKIDLRIAPALETLEAELKAGGEGQYDFAFIDADKANYDNYYEICLKLIRPGGIIALDNTLWSGLVIDASDQSPCTTAIRAINAKIAKDDRVHVSMLYLGDGTTLAFKK